MNKDVLAQNVRRIRMMKSISQQALADASGLSLPAVKTIELASGNPRMNTVQKIARALEVKLQDLFLPIRVLEAVRFRSMKRMQNRENILTEVARWVDNYNYLEKVLNEEIPFRLKELRSESSREHIIEVAEQARRKLGLKDDEPIYDICGLLESAGVKLLPLPTSSDGFFGLSVCEKDGGPAVIVNVRERIPVERRIFTAAHELGHLLLHPDAYHVAHTGENEDEEREADLFAGHFIMPDKGFRKEWNEASGQHWVDRVFKVKRIFRVSYKVVLYRLVELKAVDNSVWKRFQRDNQQRFGHKLEFKEEPMAIGGSEPFSLKKFDFLEDRFTRMIRRAIEEGKISLSRGAEMLGMGIGEMHNLLRSWEAVL